MKTYLPCVLWLLAAIAGGGEILVVNEDNSHFFGGRLPEDMTLEGLQTFVDHYADTGVTHLFLCPNAQRASYDSPVRGAIWENTRDEEGFLSAWPRNARLLHERGLDPYKIWLERCREKGISGWLSIRMNDIHNADDPTNIQHCDFWREHPEFHRNPSGKSWFDHALNFAYPEVREFSLAYIREVLERYDMDGIELDWMRFGRHLTPGNEVAEAPILTDFMREVRELVQTFEKTRGHKILISVRVPTLPEAADGLGMRAADWARAGYVDWIVPAPHWATTDFDIPVEHWKELVKDAPQEVKIIPCSEINVQSDPRYSRATLDYAGLRGWAEAVNYRGADGIYLFNWFDSRSFEASRAYFDLLKVGFAPENTASRVRRFILTYHDTVPQGISQGLQLPNQVNAEVPPTFRLRLGKAPRSGKAFVCVGIPPECNVSCLTVNGRELKDISYVTRDQQKNIVEFEIPIDSLVDGENSITVHERESFYETWVEIRLEP